MKNKFNRNEKLFDAVLKVAAEEALWNEVNAMPSCEVLNKMYPRTESLDEKINAVSKREFKKEGRKKVLSAFTKIAAGFLFIFAVSIGTLIINSALQDETDTGDAMFVLGYIPQGFSLVSTQYTFANDTGQNFTVGGVYASLEDENVSTRENAEARQQRRTLYIYDENTITWQVGEYIFAITASLDYEILEKIREGMSVN
ncbi:MAG: hypothetical protein FWB96_07625 [Defluviitaleaceae bacterium]|nr:hypothetical protein [Defluviitaleaceae bacterium]MCL2262794.1 hypothetical protein [Defluviitaleaceae bacterium]